jgi:endoribonuclease LACTB2
MITLTRHGRGADEVVRVEMSSRRSRLVGYSASAYLARGVLVDSGFSAVAGELAGQVIHALRPRAVVLTHQHEDHAGNAEMLARMNLPLAMSAATERAIRDVRPIAFYRRFTWGAMRPLVAFVDGMGAAIVAEAGLTLVPTPGHSEDHHVVWHAASATLISGDLYLGHKVRVAHPHEDVRALVPSLRLAAALGPERMFDAHRGPVESPADALLAKAAWHEETIGAVDAMIAAGLDDRTIVRRALGGESAVGWFSGGDYARTNFVRSLRRGVASSE